MAWTRDWMDTFLRYNPASAATLGKWTSITAGGTITGDDAKQGMSCTLAAKTVLSSTVGRIAGIRAKTPIDPGGGVVFNIVTFRDLTGAIPLRLDYIPSSGFLRLFPPVGAFFESTDPIGNIPNDTWANFELGLYCDGARAYYEVRVDGETVPDMVGSVVLVSSPTINKVNVGDGPTASVGKYMWVWTKKYSGAGGIWAASDFYGNVLRGHEAPDDDGQYPANAAGARWIPNGGTVKYFHRLNEALADGDTTMATNIVDPNLAPTAVDRMSVQHTDPPTTLVNVKAVQAVALMRMASGTGTARLFYGVTGSAGDTFDATDISPASSYQYEVRNPELDPRDGAAWSRAKLVNLDLGVELRDLV